jgi:dTDP-4-dehydrorhamnose reductase
MKIIVTGAGGLLGCEVWKVFSEVHDLLALGRTQPTHVSSAQWRECDLRDPAKTFSVVTRENPDLIVHCASFNDVDGAERNPDEAFRVNTLGTRNLALSCQRFDTILMAISTDYVFDGVLKRASGYQEIDPTNPISHYGESKRWGEVYAEQLLNKFYIVRTSWLFGPSRPTYADRVVELARSGEDVPCVSDMTSAPTYTPDLAKALLALSNSGLFGLYHLTNSGFCSRVDYAAEILRLNKLPGSALKKLTQADFNHPARRPVFSGLDNFAWRLNGFKPLRPWTEALVDHFSASLTSR